MRPFNAGDTAYLSPGETHQIVNVGDGEFRMYSVWWDADMATRFQSDSLASASATEAAGGAE